MAGSDCWLEVPLSRPARPRLNVPLLILGTSGDGGCSGRAAGEGCDVGIVLGTSRMPGGFVSYDPWKPFGRSGSCAGGGGSAYQFGRWGGKGSKTLNGCGGGMED